VGKELFLASPLKPKLKTKSGTLLGQKETKLSQVLDIFLA